MSHFFLVFSKNMPNLQFSLSFLVLLANKIYLKYCYIHFNISISLIDIVSFIFDTSRSVRKAFFQSFSCLHLVKNCHPCSFFAFFTGAFDAENKLQILIINFKQINLIDFWKIFLYDWAYLLYKMITLSQSSIEQFSILLVGKYKWCRTIDVFVSKKQNFKVNT